MSNIEGYMGPSLTPREARLLTRAKARNELSRETRLSRADAETDVTVGKIQDATLATGFGMRAVVAAAQQQQSLELMAPSVSGRLNMLADAHTLGVAEILDDHRHRLRRI
jgi:hypothetical protein